MVCYRRHGHNEGDEPAFTQPLMYEKIKNRISIRELYTEQLVMAGELTSQEAETIAETFADKLQRGPRGGPARRGRAAGRNRGFAGAWAGLEPQLTRSRRSRRASPSRRCAQITEKVARVPAGFTVNPKLARLLAGRVKTDARPRGRSTGRSPRCWRSARCSGKTPRSA